MQKWNSGSLALQAMHNPHMKKSIQPIPSYAGALRHAPADKRIEILRLVGQSGSISQAAREAGVSYKAAWQAVDTLTNLAGVALLVRAVGGVGGGGASLTPAGEQLLDAARQMDGARLDVLQRFSGGAAQALSGAGLRTSMRNHLPCRIAAVQASQAGDPMARVVLGLPAGTEITSLITLESAELLALQPGLSVLALCKATAVTVCAGVLPARENFNQLYGQVARLARGSLRDEVVITLPGELQLVGFATRPNRLRVGSRVTACVEENAVVLALV